MHQPSTSSNGINDIETRLEKSPPTESEENDYDVVPEYYEGDHTTNDDSGSSDNYSVLCHTAYQRTPPYPQRSTSRPNAHVTTFAANICTSPQNLVKKSHSSHQVYSSNGSNSSRHSSGIHITPSPSDSGIVDYEL
ncbi:hypothetical protein AB6A40_011243 [Gnathostoma spinigerum]|uniref:Uncharacterized protein n=1 Tax=Gnathostoma spinigerum TaxID=75299 RepID=A0ABD6F1E3_9BILA